MYCGRLATGRWEMTLLENMHCLFLSKDAAKQLKDRELFQSQHKKPPQLNKKAKQANLYDI
jgi:hypothetical protein